MYGYPTSFGSNTDRRHGLKAYAKFKRLPARTAHTTMLIKHCSPEKIRR